MIQVYIPDENLKGWIVTEMAHGAIVAYDKGGFHYEEMMGDEDYVVLNDMFFDYEGEE